MSIHENNIINLDGVVELKSYQRVVKIGDYYFPVGYNLSFYKCASVDTSTKTWTGYRAILVDSAYYYFESTITEGLKYSGNEISVGNIYSADGLAQIANLFNGLLSDGSGDNSTLVVDSNSTYDSETQTLTLNEGCVDENGVLSLNDCSL